MGFFNWISQSLEKKKIKRHFKEYGSHIEKFHLEKEGEIAFALWDNPLETPKKITQEMVDFYSRFFPKGCLALDIGAHIGDTTLPIALANGPTGTTLAFDPNPYVYKILEINAKLNPNKTQIIPYNYAIASKAGNYYFNSSEATHNNGGISLHRKNNHGKYQLNKKIKAVELEDFLKEQHPDKIEKLGFIKMDLEGMDLAVLRKIKNFLFITRPSVVAECFKKQTQKNRDELFSLFQDISYGLYHIESQNSRSPFLAIEKKEEMRKWKHFDFCAIPLEKKEAFLENK